MPNRIGQWLVLNQLNDAGREQRQRMLVDTYRRKRDSFAASLHTHIADLATWHTPPGGLFFWLDLKQALDTRTILPHAIERGVAFMPGEPFYPQAVERAGALRLNFSHSSEADARMGLQILADLLR